MQWNFINKKLKEFFESRKSLTIDRLFTLNTEASPLQPKTRPNLQIDEIDEIQKPLTTKHSSTHTKKSFNQLTHLFSPHGPARSLKSMQMRMIVAGTLKDKSNNYGNIKQNDMRRVKDYVDKQNHSKHSKLRTVNSAKLSTHNILTDMEELFDKSIQYPPNPKLQNFVRKAQSINTLQMKLTKSFPTQTSQHIKTPTPNIFKKLDFKESKDEREGLDKFLNNKWLEYVIERKSLRRDEKFPDYMEEFLKSPKCDEQKQQIKNNRIIRQNFKIPPKPLMIRPFQKQTRSVSYIKELDKQIEQYDKAINEITIRQDQDNLIEFYPGYYSYHVKKRRIKDKLRALCRRIKKGYGLNMDQGMYQQRGSVCFLKYVKAGQQQAVDVYLQKFPTLIKSFDEFGYTALHLAVMRNYRKLSHYLLDCGNEVNAEDQFGQRPLYFAILNDNFEMMKLLISYGASPWDMDRRDYFPYCRSQQSRDLLKFSQYLSITLKSMTMEVKKQALSAIQMMTYEDFKEALQSV
ncbi:SPT3 Dosage dependent suppressor of Ty-induced promoter mutations-like protein [Paramecium bursaria]